MKYIALFLLLIALESNAQNISRTEASEDIDSLVYTLTEVHPDLYYNIGMSRFCQAVYDAKNNLPDSISATELYRLCAPIVAEIGDAHTSLMLPYDNIMSGIRGFCPVYPTIDNNTGKLYVKASADNCVPYDSEILSINGLTAKQMVQKMTAYVSGERDFFKYTMADNEIMGLFHFLFAADKYDITYLEPNAKKSKNIILDPIDGDQLNDRLVLSPKILKLMGEHGSGEPYSFRILEGKNVAVLTFDACINPKGMEVFADSMFTCLKEKNIQNLIVDVRYNGGGNSNVGDALLKHIAPTPFAQFGKTYIRVTPTTKRLGGGASREPGIYFHPENASALHEPFPSDKRYKGNVYLLTSHTTFSSASSFAWAFQHYNCGTVIGEETGGMNVHFGDVLTYTLPHSNLKCNISHKRFWQPGADETSIHGVIPDIPTSQSDALNTALQMIGMKK